MIILNIPKEDFIGFLANLTPTELNTLIKENGKSPKKVNMCYFFDDYKEQKLEQNDKPKFKEAI